MKTTHLLKALIAALLLMATQSGTYAASLLADGDFDSLPVGTAPDVGKPAGRWFWPDDYRNYPGFGYDLGETAASQFSIVPAPAGGTGNALRVSFAPTEGLGVGKHLPNALARRVTNTSGEILHVSFDLYIAPGRGGGAVYLGYGPIFDTHDPALNQRGPQLEWRSSGRLVTRDITDAEITLSASYPRGVWQTVRLEIDMARQRYKLFSGEKGQPVSLTRTNVAFRAGTLPYIDRLTIVRWQENPDAADSQSYFDNIRVTTDPVNTPVSADLAAGGSTTLQLVNLQTNSTIQWQRNGQEIAGATAATLELSSVTADQAGNYTVVATRAGQSVTTEASTVRVFDKLTITTPPEKIEAVSGKTTGFSVAAVGPLPMTYQWRFNGVDLPDKTNRFLTFPANVAAAGDYTVVVSDANGSVVSPPATLTVLVPPIVTQAPLSQSVVAGGSVTFSAALHGTSTAPFTYEWRKGTDFASSTLVSRTTSAERTAFLTLNNVQPATAGTYRLYLANAAAHTITDTSVNRVWGLTVLADTDRDGLPDAWETANGLNPNDPTDANLDADTDGLSNVAEYRSGTSPFNAASGLKLESLTPTNGQTLVRFSAAALKTYTVEWSDQLSGGAWQKLTDVIARSVDRIETVTDSNAAGPCRFYRIVTPRRP